MGCLRYRCIQDPFLKPPIQMATTMTDPKALSFCIGFMSEAPTESQRPFHCTATSYRCEIRNEELLLEQYTAGAFFCYGSQSFQSLLLDAMIGLLRNPSQEMLAVDNYVIVICVVSELSIEGSQAAVVHQHADIYS